MGEILVVRKSEVCPNAVVAYPEFDKIVWRAMFNQCIYDPLLVLCKVLVFVNEVEKTNLGKPV